VHWANQGIGLSATLVIPCVVAGLACGTGPVAATTSPASLAGEDGPLRLASGGFHSCAVMESGAVRCWGSNAAGQLGTGYRDSVLGAVEVTAVRDAVDVAVGRSFSCALRRTGRVKCWGVNHGGQLGDGTTVSQNWPTEVLGVTDAIELDTGENFACAKGRQGELRCWGVVPGLGVQAQPIVVDAGSRVDELAVGNQHLCVRRSSEVMCWGAWGAGALGNGRFCPDMFEGCEPETVDRPQRVDGLAARAVEAGACHACTILHDRRVACWGCNHDGQIGLSNDVEPPLVASVPRPHVVEGLEAVDELSAGNGHTCARRAGAVRCWGAINPGPERHRPTQVPDLSDARALSSGHGFSCALRRTGDVLCWGINSGGSLGAPNPPTEVLRPVRVAGLNDATDLALRGSTCAARRTGDVVCWGGRNQSRWSPRTLAAFRDVVEVAGHRGQMCARRRDGSVVCSLEDLKAETVEVEKARGAQGLAVSEGLACFRLQRSLSCWSMYETDDGPERMPWSEGVRWKDLDVHGAGGCAVASSGEVVCWGRVAGRPDPVTRPVAIEGIRDATSVSVTRGRACATDRTGGVYCWGFPAGPERSGHTRPAVREEGVDDAVRVEVSYPVTCVVRSDGSVACWGDNDHGQLGTGDTDFHAGPQLVPSIENAEEVRCGYLHCCARGRDGTVQCWGWPHDANLGDGVERRLPAITRATVTGLLPTVSR